MSVIELFPDLPRGDAPAGKDACLAPIGRRRFRRLPPRRSRRAPLAATIAELRHWLHAELGTLGLRVAAIERHSARQTARVTATDETLDRMLARLVTIERHLGIVEAPAMPRGSRRRPLE